MLLLGCIRIEEALPTSIIKNFNSMITSYSDCSEWPLFNTAKAKKGKSFIPINIQNIPVFQPFNVGATQKTIDDDANDVDLS